MFTKADFDRIVETHEPHYFAAQARGFTLIKEIERYLDEADSYEGRYKGYVNQDGDLIITGEYADECDQALKNAREIGRMVARSNGYRILAAQGRTDDAAMVVYEEYDKLFPRYR